MSKGIEDRVRAIEAITVKLDGPPGQGYRTVAWGRENTVLVISPVETFEEFVELLERIQGSRAEPAAKPPERPLVENTPAKPPAVQDAHFEPTQKLEQNGSSGEDFTVFGPMTRVSEIIGEVVRRGHKDFASISSFLKQLEDSKACPAIDRVKKQGGWEDRVRRHCAAQGIPGAV